MCWKEESKHETLKFSHAYLLFSIQLAWFVQVLQVVAICRKSITNALDLRLDCSRFIKNNEAYLGYRFPVSIHSPATQRRETNVAISASGTKQHTFEPNFVSDGQYAGYI